MFVYFCQLLSSIAKLLEDAAILLLRYCIEYTQDTQETIRNIKYQPNSLNVFSYSFHLQNFNGFTYVRRREAETIINILHYLKI